MLHTSALPFVLRREHGVISHGEVMSTREELHGLLWLDGERLVVQWRAVREISRVGREIRTDRELVPVREVALPLSEIAGARIRRDWHKWWPRQVLVLTASDMRAFEPLTAEDGVPGLVLEHPAEIVLELRRTDHLLAREFVSELKLAVNEHLLQLLEEEEHQRLLSRPGTPSSGALGDAP